MSIVAEDTFMLDSYRPNFRELFSEQVSLPDEQVDLQRCALYFAGEEHPSLIVEEYLARLDVMADRVLADSKGAGDNESLARALNGYLFDEEKFTGNPADYYNPDNSYLNRVMDSRIGIPITLSVLYLGVAERLGLNCYGVGMPGHFLVALKDLDLFLDPFHSGQLLSAADCRRLTRDMFGPDSAWTEEYLAPCPRKLIIYRMLNNLRQIYLNKRDYGRHVYIVEKMLLVDPAVSALYLELAQSQVHRGETEAALRSLQSLKESPASQKERDVADELIEILLRGHPRAD